MSGPKLPPSLRITVPPQARTGGAGPTAPLSPSRTPSSPQGPGGLSSLPTALQAGGGRLSTAPRQASAFPQRPPPTFAPGSTAAKLFSPQTGLPSPPASPNRPSSPYGFASAMMPEVGQFSRPSTPASPDGHHHHSGGVHGHHGQSRDTLTAQDKQAAENAGRPQFSPRPNVYGERPSTPNYSTGMKRPFDSQQEMATPYQGPPRPMKQPRMSHEHTYAPQPQFQPRPPVNGYGGQQHQTTGIRRPPEQHMQQAQHASQRPAVDPQAYKENLVTVQQEPQRSTWGKFTHKMGKIADAWTSPSGPTKNRTDGYNTGGGGSGGSSGGGAVGY